MNPRVAINTSNNPHTGRFGSLSGGPTVITKGGSVDGGGGGGGEMKSGPDKGFSVKDSSGEVSSPITLHESFSGEEVRQELNFCGK
jgi:hypothetical protein